MMMPDKFSKETRSKIMASIKSKNTLPEIAIRRMLWNFGFRYRIHDSSIFGNPDISNKHRKIAIFVDGCFWHGCNRCYKEPKTNSYFWKNKITSNKKRRKTVKRELRKDNWNILELWEHEINQDPKKIEAKLKKFCLIDVNI